MTRSIRRLMAAALVAGLALGATAAAVPGEKRVQLSLSLGVLALFDRQSSLAGSKTSFGPGLRVDFNLGRSIFIAPEASAGIGGWSLGGTINFHSRNLFAGAGYLAARMGGNWDEWGINSLFKVQAGYKGPHATIAASFVANRWIKGFGLTAGYVF